MYEEHAHTVPSPLTETEAREKLNELTLTALHDIAMAEGIPTSNNRESQTTGILLAWFHAGDGDDRALSFQAVLDQAEKLPQGKRRAWRKRTHGKEMGF